MSLLLQLSRSIESSNWRESGRGSNNVECVSPMDSIFIRSNDNANQSRGNNRTRVPRSRFPKRQEVPQLKSRFRINPTSSVGLWGTRYKLLFYLDATNNCDSTVLPANGGIVLKGLTLVSVLFNIRSSPMFDLPLNFISNRDKQGIVITCDLIAD